MVKSIVLCVFAVAFAPAHGEPLSFSSALKKAEENAPDLALESAAVNAAKAASKSAGSWPDPKLAIGVENVPAEGADAWSLSRDMMTMRKVGIMQDFPSRQKSAASRDLAAASISKAQAEEHIRRIEVRRDTAVAWINRYYIEKQSALLDELDRENLLFATSTQAQVVSGRSNPADAIEPKQEAADLADRRDALASAVAKAKADLSRWVGDDGAELLAGDPPTIAIEAAVLREHIAKHPELIALVPVAEMAQAELYEAQAMKSPDWGLELAYGKRGSMFDDMVSLQVTVGLPVFSGRRQDPLIESKRQALKGVDAERLKMLKDHTRELEVELADYDNLSRQLERMSQTRIPLATERVDYQYASYRGGTAALSSVLAARRELIELKFKQLDLRAQQQILAAKLYYSYGEGAR